MSNRIPSELTCKQLVELVTDYLEGQLAPDDRARFEQHLLYCDGCADYLRQIRDAVRVTRRPVGEQLTPQMEQDLLHAFRGWKKG